MANQTQAQIRYHFGLPWGEGMAEEHQGFLCKMRSGKGLPAKLMYVRVWGFPSTCFFKESPEGVYSGAPNPLPSPILTALVSKSFIRTGPF